MVHPICVRRACLGSTRMHPQHLLHIKFVRCSYHGGTFPYPCVSQSRTCFLGKKFVFDIGIMRKPMRKHEEVVDHAEIHLQVVAAFMFLIDGICQSLLRRNASVRQYLADSPIYVSPAIGS